jgi:hypothetical protein
MQEGMDKLVIPKLPELGKITPEEEAEYFGEEAGDIFAPINNVSMLDMVFSDDEDEDGDFEDGMGDEIEA